MAASWKLPGYIVEELLGSGGSGEVWRARVAASGDAVALKRIPITDPEQLRAARREAAVLSVLEHPHLIRLHALVPTAQAAVLVLDLAAGGSLAHLLRRRARLTPGETVSALAPIGAALAYAHNEGVVHGDVSPANILFSGTGQPVLADLGVARIIGDAAPVRGTPGYLDPVVAAGSPPGMRSDVFMLAAVGVHLLTGSPLWPDADDTAAAAAGDLSALPDRLADLPGALVAVLMRALVVQPDLRSTAAEFALDVRHCLPPAPIELHAGRDRAVRPRPHGDANGAGYTGRHRSGRNASASPGRPAFDEQRPPTDDVPRDPLTHEIRAALRPVLPPPRRSLPSLLGRWPVVALIAILGAAAIAWQLARTSHRHERIGVVAPEVRPSTGGDSAVGGLAGPIASSPVGPAADMSPAARSPDPSRTRATTDTDAIADLVSLDRLRGQAFADNQPMLLAKVYQPGPLLAQDTALLVRSVPSGCSLRGVHTSYTGVQATSRGDRVLVTTVATLARSVLVCAGAPSATGAGEGPARLHIELVRTDSGSRIVSQRRM